jgi:hypothetical protein
MPEVEMQHHVQIISYFLLQVNDAFGLVNHGSNTSAPIKYNSVAVGVCPIPDFGWN